MITSVTHYSELVLTYNAITGDATNGGFGQYWLVLLGSTKNSFVIYDD